MPVASRSKSKKTEEKEEAELEKEFAAIKKQKEFTPDQATPYFLLALLVSSSPVFLFHTVYDLGVLSYGLVYAALTLVSAVLLTIAYNNVQSTQNDMLVQGRKRVSTGQTPNQFGMSSREEMDAMRVAVTHRESVFWSFFLNNLIYTSIFMFLAFYVFKAMDVELRYPIAVIVSAGSVWRLSMPSENVA
eukprot:gb/GEZN01020338.1/.p1 GENE.gb/GEZN01020338.1/~~gb/GEZN01020338.1/.p1  ORF type:complete len:189 (-),score=34.60 gb/GEZN01020338.1/:81-647(-)